MSGISRHFINRVGNSPQWFFCNQNRRRLSLGADAEPQEHARLPLGKDSSEGVRSSRRDLERSNTSVRKKSTRAVWVHDWLELQSAHKLLRQYFFWDKLGLCLPAKRIFCYLTLNDGCRVSLFKGCSVSDERNRLPPPHVHTTPWEVIINMWLLWIWFYCVTFAQRWTVWIWSSWSGLLACPEHTRWQEKIPSNPTSVPWLCNTFTIALFKQKKLQFSETILFYPHVYKKIIIKKEKNLSSWQEIFLLNCLCKHSLVMFPSHVSVPSF